MVIAAVALIRVSMAAALTAMPPQPQIPMMPILQYSSEIRSAVLLVHGEKAHSSYFSETAYGKLTGDNKELLIIPGASHTDLYDQMDIIPFGKLKAFFEEYLK